MRRQGTGVAETQIWHTYSASDAIPRQNTKCVELDAEPQRSKRENNFSHIENNFLLKYV